MRHTLIKSICAYLMIGTSFMLLICACSATRTEFYREESKHLYNQGKAAYESGQYDSARDHFTRITEYDPAHSQAWVGLGNICYLENDMKTAQACYRKAVEIDPDLRQQISARITIATYREKRQRSLEKPFNLRKALDLLLAGNTTAFDRQASTSTSLAEITQATAAVSFAEIADLEKLIRKRMADSNAPPKTRLFCAYFLLFNSKTGREEAVVHIQEAASLVNETHQLEAFVVLGQYYYRIGENNKAIIYFKAALEAGASEESIAPELARIYRIPPEDVTGEDAL